MPRRVTQLTHIEVDTAKPKNKQYRMTDGQGLYLLVTPAGGKLWRLDYTFNGKRKTFAIGKYPEISLENARKRGKEQKKLIAEGVDPVRHKKLSQRLEIENAQNTFGAKAAEWLLLRKNWTEGHARTVRSRLKRDILPWLGDLPISEITAPEILKVLRRIEGRGAGETAHRCKTIISQVFRFAIATGAAERDPAADLRGALAPTRAKRMAAITDPEEAGALMRAISDYQGDIITRCGLKFSALTFCRPGEVRHAEWNEINWIKAEWLIPAGKMKMRREHLVPLSHQVLEVLRELHPLTGTGRYIFPSLRTGSRPMSNNTILGALRRMGFTKEEMTPHGFRSMASTLLHENGFFAEIIELQLAHAPKNQVAAAYNRSRRLPERKKMMQWWADYLEALEKGNTVAEMVVGA